MFFAFRTGRRLRIGGRSPFEHVFGGNGGFACYQKKRRLKCLRHVMTLRTEDPLVGKDGEVAVFDKFGSRIPIYYDPEFATDLQYLVNEQDMMVHVLRREETGIGLTFPLLEDVSEQWPEHSISLEHIPYDLTKTLGWVSLAQAHNLKLSAEDETTAEENQYPFHQWGGFFEVFPDDWKFHSCANDKCENRGGSLSLAGVLLGDLTREFGLVDAAEEPFQLLIEVCGMCASVRTSLRNSMGEVEATAIE